MRASLHARLAKVEQVVAPEHRTVVLRIAYDSEGVDWEQVEPFAGVEYVVVLPQKAPSAELWAQHMRQRFQSERRIDGPLPDGNPTAGR
jgi:hypothetical protein